jgi:hypothetical protein
MGVLVFLLTAIFCPFAWMGVFRKWSPIRNEAFNFGASGLCGLASMGALAYFGGLVRIPVALFAAGLVVGIGIQQFITQPKPKVSFQEFGVEKFLIIPVTFFLLVPLVGVLSPSTMLDWDSLAYHLAVPKLWIQQGKVSAISYIHHSNFPAGVDGLFLIGEHFSPSSLSKSFVWLFTAFGATSIYGLVHELIEKLEIGFSPRASGFLGSMILLTIPMVIWESGTAYIDVANGLFAGIGFVLVAYCCWKEDSKGLMIAGLLLGFAASTKYTGLQSILIATFVAALFSTNKSRKYVIQMLVISGVVAAPWYLKNWITVGNPVYPFFFSLFGGKNWDLFSSMIYTEEQKFFGYQGFTHLGQSVLGLGLTPGRFTNPSPQLGAGFTFVSLGFLILATGFAGIASGVRNKLSGSILSMIGIQLLAWSVLSQQSRYILVLVVPMIALFVPLLETKIMRALLSIGLVIQSAVSLKLYNESMVGERLPVVIGALTQEEFLGGFEVEGKRIPGKVAFYEAAKFINSETQIKKVGLFDEVFGYYLDKPYIWANPGHTTELGYSDMKTAREFIDSLKRQGITHAYLNNQFISGTENESFFYSVTGLGGSIKEPYPVERRAKLMEDQRTKWRVLLNEAIAEGQLGLTRQFSKTRFLFEIR